MFQFKRGATFDPTITYAPGSGDLANLLGAVVTSALKTRTGTVVTTFNAVVAGDGLSVALTPVVPTSGWALGEMSWDVKIVVGGITIYTDTATFNVIDAITP